MAYEKQDGTPVQTGTWEVYAVYEFIVKHNDGIVYEAHETPEQAVASARAWLIEEMGGTDFEVSEVDAMTDEQVLDTIIDYDHVAFADVAHRRILFG
jgi:hypothetical protein